MSNPEPEAEQQTEKEQMRYTCENKECRAFGAVLEPDEMVVEEGALEGTCIYCGERAVAAPDEKS